MVRTADMAIKTGGKNSKRANATNTNVNRSPSATDRAYSSYNSVCHRETPSWQKPITSFFQNVEKPQNETEEIQDKSPENEVEDIAMEDEVSTTNGETTTNNGNNEESETLENPMEESVSLVQKIRRREEDYEMAPRKKAKLDAKAYANLQNYEMDGKHE